MHGTAGNSPGGANQAAGIQAAGIQAAGIQAAGTQAAGNQAAGNGAVLQQAVLRGSSKAPFFEGAFELYRVELELFLDERNAWNIVTGDEGRPTTGEAEQADFDKRDRLARATILRGLRGGRKTEDAAKVCNLLTAHDMWETLVSDYTQRDFSYAVLLRRQLYQCFHEQDQLMADYLRTMTHMRQQLRNVGSEHAISDDEMARLLLMGVAMTHRELVEQFDLPTRQGSPPTLQQVTNALRSRDECDRMANGNQGGGVVMNMNTGGGGSRGYAGNNGGGVGGHAGNSSGQGDRGGRKSLPKCNHCKKPGHLKRDCYQYKNKQAKVKAGQSSDVKKKAWSKNKTKKEPGVIEHMEFLHNGDEDSSGSEEDSIIGMFQPTIVSKNACEWMLDTGTSMHVCINRDIFVTQKQSKTTFRVWDVQVTRGVMSGQVVIYTKNQNSDELVKFELSNVEYSPHGSVNLISLGVMEDNGWEMSSSPSGESPRRIFLEQPSAQERLEFVRRGKRYWLKTVELDTSDTGMAMTTVNADANALMRWHERLGHLHVAAIKHMVDNGTVAGMEIPAALFKKKFTCLSCMSAKRKRMSYKASAAEKRTKINYERLASDTCDMGKFHPGLGRMRYFQLIHDEGSRYKWYFPLKSKGDANANTIKLTTELLVVGHRIKSFTSDGGGEFVNTELKLFMEAR
ncbi:hypothetical protein PF005_g1215 [Phytophthora fragariae]|uniref:CCHC-type domain-containing protein n=1 Tax=Phytophthora fragariae TaxID=53985 RepID=A0A6A3ZJ79_9STRA|nr:hypothetical protein PF005_g1215 [Phytophthora fragariae]